MIKPDKTTIDQAAGRIAPYLHKTPLLTCNAINHMFGGQIFFKCENFQKAGAFKSRGATNAVFQLSEAEISNGVATHSSGNHAAALALAAKRRNARAHIVMPSNSNKLKIKAVQEYGGLITFCEPNLQARENTLHEILLQTNATEIHPYNDLRIIAGQATACKEMIAEVNDLQIIMAPVGGGGLLSGTALASNYYGKEITVIGAEPEGAADAYQSFYSKTFIPSVNPVTIADGLLTSLGSITFPIILDYVHQIATVSESSIAEAMKLIWERMKIIVEPSSAVPLAAILEGKVDIRQKRVGIILSGGNVDLTALPF